MSETNFDHHLDLANHASPGHALLLSPSTGFSSADVERYVIVDLGCDLVIVPTLAFDTKIVDGVAR